MMDDSWHEAISLIDKVRKTKASVLNLRLLRLKSLPERIADLDWLEDLILWGNQLTLLPKWLGELHNLRVLDVSFNQLTALPEWMGALNNLQTLKISHNQLATLPEELRALSNLQTLDVGTNQLTVLPEWLRELCNLRTLDVSCNQLMALPEWLEALSNLQTLDVGTNQLTALPEGLRTLSNLQILDASSNQLIALPEWLEALGNLQKLNVSRNQLTTLPEWLEALGNLQKLNVSSNQLIALPEWLGALSNLNILDVRNNQLTALPEWLGALSNLKILDVSSNQLTALPEWMGVLSNLQTLDISSNQLTALPEWLEALSNLKILDVRNNQLTILPKWLGGSSDLQTLNLSNNQLTALPEWLGTLRNLRILDVRNNQLTVLPEGLGRLSNIQTLDVWENPLVYPPLEIAENGVSAVRQYFEQIAREGSVQAYEARLLIIGEPEAGKTTLARVLKNPDYEVGGEETTEGIEVLDFDFQSLAGQTIQTHIWDFGGQEIYKATHRFFLTTRSLYIILADDRAENTDYFYWLHSVDLLSNGAPVIIIHNEKDDRQKEIDLGLYRKEFKNLVEPEPLRCNLKTRRGFDEVRHKIEYHLSQLDCIGRSLPKTWVEVRNALEKTGKDHITQNEYLELCRESGIDREADALQLSDFLHQIGAILHFQRDPMLEDLVILNPEWGTDAVYRVLDTDLVKEKMGCVGMGDLCEIWHEEKYTGHWHQLIHLMQQFQLCYALPQDHQTYILPQLLPKTPAADFVWQEQNELVVRYDFTEFYLKGLFTRFVVQEHERIADESRAVWRFGVILEKEDAQAMVIADEKRNRFEIRVGEGTFQRELLAVIMDGLDSILKEFPRLKHEVLVPCNCEACLTRIAKENDPHLFRMSELRKRLRYGIITIECGEEPFTSVNIVRLIENSVGRDRVLGKNDDKGMFEGANIEKIIMGDDRGVHAERIEKSVVVTGDSNQIEQAFTKIRELVPESALKPGIDNAVEELEAEAKKGEKADAGNVRKWLDFLAATAPDVFEVAVNTFINPVYGFSTVMRKVAERAKAGK